MKINSASSRVIVASRYYAQIWVYVEGTSTWIQIGSTLDTGSLVYSNVAINGAGDIIALGSPG